MKALKLKEVRQANDPLLTVRRVVLQNISENGNSQTPADYYVLARIEDKTLLSNPYPSMNALNHAIKEAGSIIKLIPNYRELYICIDVSKIGTDNYSGTDYGTPIQVLEEVELNEVEREVVRQEEQEEMEQYAHWWAV